MTRLLALCLLLIPCCAEQSQVIEPAGAPAPEARPEAGPGARISGAPSSVTTAPAEISPTDAQFLNDAAWDGLKEVRLGDLAMERAKGLEVRRFADQLVGDHRRINEELSLLATKKNVALPVTLPLRERRIVDRLTAREGEDFDRAWLREIVDGHRNDIEKFERQARETQDEEVKAFALRTLPVLQGHLRRAEELRRSVGQGGSER